MSADIYVGNLPFSATAEAIQELFKETAMPNHPSTTARITAVQSYLEEEFPGCVEAARKHVIVVSHHGMRHHVVLQPSFLHLCPDYMRALRESELADYMREARSHARRFLVVWQERATHIRSTALRGSLV